MRRALLAGRRAARPHGTQVLALTAREDPPRSRADPLRKGGHRVAQQFALRRGRAPFSRPDQGDPQRLRDRGGDGVSVEWQDARLDEIRALIRATLPDAVEERKWKKPTN